MLSGRSEVQTLDWVHWPPAACRKWTFPRHKAEKRPEAEADTEKQKRVTLCQPAATGSIKCSEQSESHLYPWNHSNNKHKSGLKFNKINENMGLSEGKAQSLLSYRRYSVFSKKVWSLWKSKKKKFSQETKQSPQQSTEVDLTGNIK